jgi:hypothetical protein
MALSFRRALALALVAVGGSGCREMPPTFAPTPVATGTGLVSFSANGPGGLASGEQAQFNATAYFENRDQVNVTFQTAWSSSEPAVLSVGPDGVAIAHTPGTATVSATYRGRTIATPIVVTPAGTFRLTLAVWGLYDARVPDVKRPVDANVEIIAGVGTGQRAALVDPEDSPAYVLYGVAGLLTIAVSAPAFVSQTIDLTVQGHMRQDVVLMPAPTGN